MTKFNPHNKIELTFGDCLEPAMEIKSKKDAMQYLQNYVEFIEKDLVNDNDVLSDIEKREKAFKIAKYNLGYYAGYYSNEVRKRVEKLFECEHPMFGSIAKYGIPSSQQALEIGKRIGTILKEKQENK